jgi:hypothetical protein
MRPLLILIVLLGCRAELHGGEFAPLSLEERVAVDAAVATWEAHGLALPARCDAARLRVVRDAEPFEQLCAAPPRGADASCPEGATACAVGCFDLARTGGTAWRESNASPVIAVAPELGADDAARVLVHEAFHWLGWCSGEGRDSWHVRESWWGDSQSYPEGGLVGEALARMEP